MWLHETVASLLTVAALVPDVNVPRGPWWELGLLLVGLTKFAVLGIPVFCAYQAVKAQQDPSQGDSGFWWLGAAVSAGGIFGWYLA